MIMEQNWAWRTLLHALADEDDPKRQLINAIMHDEGTDKDGRISYEEFATMMKAGIDWRKDRTLSKLGFAVLLMIVNNRRTYFMYLKGYYLKDLVPVWLC